jgi:hypothetical protein
MTLSASAIAKSSELEARKPGAAGLGEVCCALSVLVAHQESRNTSRLLVSDIAKRFTLSIFWNFLPEAKKFQNTLLDNSPAAAMF